MPIYMEISQLHRTVTIVARGAIDADEIRGMAMKLFEAKVTDDDWIAFRACLYLSRWSGVAA